MTRWVPFLWLTGVVLVALLVLARLSSAVVRDDSPDGATLPTPDPDHLGEPTIARGESTTGPESTGETRTGRRGDPADPPAHADAPVHPRPGSADWPDGPDRPPTTPDRSDRLPADASQEPVARSPSSEPARRTISLDGERVELTTGTLLANVAVTQGLVGLVLVAGIWWFEIPGWALGVTEAPWVGGTPAVSLGLAFGLVLWMGNEVAAVLADAVGATYDEAVRAMLAPDSPIGWAVLLGLVLPTVAVVEELLFRGALIGVTAAATGVSPWALAVVSSVAFALGHGAQGRAGIAVTGVLGFVLAAGYVLSGSLVVVVVAHYVINAVEFVVHEGMGYERLLGG